MRSADDLDSKYFSNVGGAFAPRLDSSKARSRGTKAPPPLKRLLRRWERLLPIDNEFPKSDGVRLPDLKKMARLRASVAVESILSVVVGEIGRLTHVAAQLLE